MNRPKLLDLFCGAGGCSMGYHRAGFDVVGVDINPQPHYPFEFHQADALTFPLEGFDVIHASPPCQAFSSMTKGRWKNRHHPNFIEAVRDRLKDSRKPYVIENVKGAPLINPFMLCGTMFGLETSYGNQLIRHRIFESPELFFLKPRCRHNGLSAIGVYGGGQHPLRRSRLRNRDLTADGREFGIKERKQAMGIDWMSSKELNEAIPPAYTEFIGRQLMQYLEKAA